MDLLKLVKENISEHNKLFNNFEDKLILDIVKAGKLIADGLKKEATIFWCGNGGSSSDAQHLNAELVGRFKKNRKPLRSLALNSDTAVITSISNDFDYSNIYARQIEALAKENDILVGISTSGNSKNIIKAFEVASKLNLTNIGLLGKNGGMSLSKCQYNILIPSYSTARIQECHIMIGHIICDIIESELGLN